MSKSAYISCLVGFVFVNVPIATGAITMTFEEFVGFDGAPLSTFYNGVTFQAGGTGQSWIASDATTGAYNASSWPSGQAWNGGEYWIHDYAAAWTGAVGNDGRISFDNEDATFVQLAYSAGYALFLEAYDSVGSMIDVDSGPGNLRYFNGNPSGPGTLRVDAPAGQYISYVLVHDSGDFWIVDNVETDASGVVISPIPAPGAVALAGLGMGLVGLLRRRRIV